MKRYSVRYLAEATEALRNAFVHIRRDAGPQRAATWLRKIYTSIDHLETAPRATRYEGVFDGHELRSKLVAAHRVFFAIDDDTQAVHVIDVVHTARQTKLDQYTGAGMR